MTMGRAHEKLSKAVRTLALGRGPIKERLTAACRKIHPTAPWHDSLPLDLALRVKAFGERTSLDLAGAEGAIAATVDRMSEDEAVEVAEEILYLEYAIRTAADMGS